MRSLAAGGAATLALLVLLAVLGAAGGAAQPEQPAETLRVELRADGDADWTVILRIDLDSPNETEGFERLATEFEDGESDVLSPGPYREAADRAGEATGRSMEIEDVSRRAWRHNDTGQLELSFTWTAFARQTDDRLLLGDVFQTEDGTWLPRLEADQAFVVRFPDGFNVVNTSHNIERRAFEIRGPTSFDPRMPSATLVRDVPTTESPGTPGTPGSPGTSVSPGTNGTPVEPPQRSDWEVIGVGALLVLIGALAVLVERRRRTDGGSGSTGSGNDDRPDVPEAADGGGAAGVGAAGTPDLDEGADGSRAEPLLSDDERILRLLHRNDGRMKQGQIVEETDWSNAKVSQLLSEMSENERINKLRIGRENLISLPGEGPDDDE